ncbi:hypothetical protein EVAR_97175_1 [Eumeta japonica]|uniref:Uncharacterized protein n=1 Tax=Eumeta variegata TaxID=151549 RepID=A0A4C1XT42_EUMVA|nr:hypothetical protein EVAR_97175_1 [Eumeta japonica]
MYHQLVFAQTGPGLAAGEQTAEVSTRRCLVSKFKLDKANVSRFRSRSVSLSLLDSTVTFLDLEEPLNSVIVPIA